MCFNHIQLVYRKKMTIKPLSSSGGHHSRSQSDFLLYIFFFTLDFLLIVLLGKALGWYRTGKQLELNLTFFFRKSLI